MPMIMSVVLMPVMSVPFQWHHRTVIVVGVVVVVVIKRQLVRCPGAEQLGKSGVDTNFLWPAGTADMAVQANHPVGAAHHQVQVVAYHQNAATASIPDPRQQLEQCRLAGYIHALGRFIEHQ